MRVLVVKLTSMGDAVHLLPALTDLRTHHPDAVVDWMVEDSFAEIPHWHSSVDRVIPVATRRWRRFNRASLTEFTQFWRRLRKVRYDVIVDAQGLMKSAIFARFARLQRGGVRAGFSGDSIKESPAAWLYNKCVPVPRDQHAITRLRRLVAGALSYPVPDNAPDYDIHLPELRSRTSFDPNGQLKPVLLLHGTTWPTKHLPDQLWRDLAAHITTQGFPVAVTWGNAAEKARAEWIAQGDAPVTVIPKAPLTEVAHLLSRAAGAVAVDTGLGHLAAALSLPCVSIYGSTNAGLTGTRGARQVPLQSDYACSPCLLKKCPKLTAQITTPPCYQQFDAAIIWQQLQQQII
ncbi:ADP-heptose--LPS heptosyltransferase [Arenicella chitinivorans]|uniref:Lipopolysaccharide heptosyltransferase 1 n=1 Tax=Arenicella chitinivorans TaxID=1329800 RepID=A0A918VI62_9GAMM|nr:lipopolysaccharide heptosyltransferase I [Arenicella chitinivorans]GHA03346.1 ADP-heptose--LPS heptosyltransferase [Arenicella chitinivorans]